MATVLAGAGALAGDAPDPTPRTSVDDLEPAGAPGWVSEQVWFGPAERPLFGHLVTPATGRVLGGVVLCAPVGEEGRAAHRTFRQLAEALGAAGLAALRFDYDGSGDSAGGQHDPDRVGAWLGSIGAARDLLRRRGIGSVSAVGMRLGATMAAHQAAAHGGLDSLVLWDPCRSGRTFLREGQALYAFSVGVRWGINEADQTPPDDGYRYTPGFRYDPATVAAMRGLDLGRLPDDVPLAQRLLVLTRPDRPEPALEGLGRAASLVEEGPALGQDLLLDREPSDNHVPTRTLATVVAWLRAGVEPAAGPPAPGVAAVAGPTATRGADEVRLGATAAPGVLVPSAGEGSAPVRERAVHLGAARLFGVVTEPVAGVAPGTPWVVLINVAAEHHIGPGRQWVEWARSWAADGVRAIRLDQSGVGDSPVPSGQIGGQLYVGAWLDDVADLVDDLRAVDGAPVALVGLCSGGNSALEAALRTRVDTVVALNPAITMYDAAPGGPWHDPARRAASYPPRPLARLWRAHRRTGAGVWRVYRQLALHRAPLRVLARVRARGTRLHVVCGPYDGREFLEVAGTRPLLWWLRRRRGVVLDVDPTLDHSLLTHRTQQLARERATRVVRELTDVRR